MGVTVPCRSQTKSLVRCRTRYEIQWRTRLYSPFRPLSSVQWLAAGNFIREETKEEKVGSILRGRDDISAQKELASIEGYVSPGNAEVF